MTSSPRSGVTRPFSASAATTACSTNRRALLRLRLPGGVDGSPKWSGRSWLALLCTMMVRRTDARIAPRMQCCPRLRAGRLARRGLLTTRAALRRGLLPLPRLQCWSVSMRRCCCFLLLARADDFLPSRSSLLVSYRPLALAYFTAPRATRGLVRSRLLASSSLYRRRRVTALWDSRTAQNWSNLRLGSFARFSFLRVRSFAGARVSLAFVTA